MFHVQSGKLSSSVSYSHDKLGPVSVYLSHEHCNLRSCLSLPLQTSQAVEMHVASLSDRNNKHPAEDGQVISTTTSSTFQSLFQCKSQTTTAFHLHLFAGQTLAKVYSGCVLK